MRSHALAVLSWIAGAGAATAEQTRAPAAPASNYRVEVVARGLNHPWALQFLPDGRLLVTERPGRLRMVEKDGRLLPPLDGLPKIQAGGQGGLLDIALAPDFAASGRIALTFSEPRGEDGNGTSVATGRLVRGGTADRLADVKVIFRQQPAGRGGLHFGSRLAFGPDGMLFVTLGERYEKETAQDLARHWGKVVRINLDGTAPQDNPFISRSGALPEIWSYGHRNPQSAAIHPGTGKLWIVEHGPQGGDEVNIPAKGLNYGWPVVGHGIDYSGARIHAGAHRQGMEQPIYYWTPSIAPSGMAFYTGRLFPRWAGNLFVGALAGQALHRLVLDGETVVAEEVLLKGRRERIRDVRQGPDGALWLLTDDTDGKVLRIAP